MKQLILILTIFSLTSVVSCRQNSHKIKSTFAAYKIIDSLKKTIGTNWIRQNPKFEKTMASFFTNDTEKNYLVCFINISGQSNPFVSDQQFALAEFLLSIDSNAEIIQGLDADKNYKGSKISWKRNITGLIYFNNESYKAPINNWHLSELNECPGSRNFPNLIFEKVTEIPNAITNNFQGLGIIPFNDEIKIETMPTIMQTVSGQSVSGIGYDLNGDKIFDVFIYNEKIDESTNYYRIYINVSGVWKCKWVNLDEVCV